MLVLRVNCNRRLKLCYRINFYVLSVNSKKNTNLQFYTQTPMSAQFARPKKLYSGGLCMPNSNFTCIIGRICVSVCVFGGAGGRSALVCCISLNCRERKESKSNAYLLYDDGETALSGGCLFTFGLTLLTCLMEFACMLTDCCCCSCCCCCWCGFSCCCSCCCCGPINWGCCCALSCCDEPVMPPFDRRLRFITANKHNHIIYFVPHTYVAIV